MRTEEGHRLHRNGWFFVNVFFPQQRELMGSSAQITVPVCAGVGSGAMFRKVPEGCRGFRRVLV